MNCEICGREMDYEEDEDIIIETETDRIVCIYHCDACIQCGLLFVKKFDGGRVWQNDYFCENCWDNL